MYKKNSRPYLIATYSAKPSKGEQTFRKNFKTEGKWDVHETVFFEDKIRNKYLTEAKVIIDIINAKVIKNGYSDEKNEQEILEYFIKKYNDKVQESIRNWMIKQSIQPNEEQLAMMEFNVKTPGIIGRVLSGEAFPVDIDVTDKIKIES